MFDLAEATRKLWQPEDKLKLWKDVPNLKVLVCGGDGTMGWMFSCVDRYVTSSKHKQTSMFTCTQLRKKLIAGCKSKHSLVEGTSCSKVCCTKKIVCMQCGRFFASILHPTISTPCSVTLPPSAKPFCNAALAGNSICCAYYDCDVSKRAYIEYIDLCNYTMG